jgi:hypothetical protein
MEISAEVLSRLGGPGTTMIHACVPIDMVSGRGEDELEQVRWQGVIVFEIYGRSIKVRSVEGHWT